MEKIASIRKTLSTRAEIRESAATTDEAPKEADNCDSNDLRKRSCESAIH